MSEKNTHNHEAEPMTPDQILKYMADLGKQLEYQATVDLAMLEEAKDRGVDVNPMRDGELEKFAELGEYEITLIQLIAKLREVSSDLFLQGIKMTSEDLDNRLRIMGKIEVKDRYIGKEPKQNAGKTAIELF